MDKGTRVPGVTRKLTDLQERELAELLGLTVGEAREWLKIAESISRGNEVNAFDAVTISPRISSRLQSIRHLVRLSVEEVRWLIHSGELYRLYPYYNAKPPEYIGLRWRQLQDLLSDENEFSARYPAAGEAVFGRLPTSGLPLPSLGIRVMRNAPQAHLIRAGWFSEWRASQDSSDAYSATFHRGDKGVPPIDQEYLPIDLGYLRGVLLAIVTREEHAERVATELHRHELHESPEAPRPSLIRITDLRLAKDIRPKELRDELTPSLSLLKAPITAERVAQWKRHVLKEDFDLKAYRHHDKDNKIISVSFAAAAILLFLDLNLPGTPDAEQASWERRYSLCTRS